MRSHLRILVLMSIITLTSQSVSAMDYNNLLSLLNIEKTEQVETLVNSMAQELNAYNQELTACINKTKLEITRQNTKLLNDNGNNEIQVGKLVTEYDELSNKMVFHQSKVEQLKTRYSSNIDEIAALERSRPTNLGPFSFFTPNDERKRKQINRKIKRLAQELIGWQQQIMDENVQMQSLDTRLNQLEQQIGSGHATIAKLKTSVKNLQEMQYQVQQFEQTIDSIKRGLTPQKLSRLIKKIQNKPNLDDKAHALLTYGWSLLS